MFLLKQFLKELILPPFPWLFLLFIVLIFWRRRWARTLLFVTFCLIAALHSALVGYALRYPLESRYPPLKDPARAEPYDAIVVLTAGSIPATGLIPFPSVDGEMFRRLDEAWRLYRLRPKPIVVSGGLLIRSRRPEMKIRLRATTSSFGEYQSATCWRRTNHGILSKAPSKSRRFCG